MHKPVQLILDGLFAFGRSKNSARLRRAFQLRTWLGIASPDGRNWLRPASCWAIACRAHFLARCCSSMWMAASAWKMPHQVPGSGAPAGTGRPGMDEAKRKGKSRVAIAPAEAESAEAR